MDPSPATSRVRLCMGAPCRRDYSKETCIWPKTESFALKSSQRRGRRGLLNTSNLPRPPRMFPPPSPSLFHKGGGGSMARCSPVSTPLYSGIGFGPVGKDSLGSSHCSSSSFTMQSNYSLLGQAWRTSTSLSSSCVPLLFTG